MELFLSFLFFLLKYTEEKLGSAEKTEFDGHYDSLIQQYESTKLWTEKLMAGAQAVLIPNPGIPDPPFIQGAAEQIEWLGEGTPLNCLINSAINGNQLYDGCQEELGINKKNY